MATTPGSITDKVIGTLEGIVGPDFAATLRKSPFILYFGIVLIILIIWMAFSGGSKRGFLAGKKSHRRRRKKKLISL